jgi:hypothetical protein
MSANPPDGQAADKRPLVFTWADGKPICRVAVPTLDGTAGLACDLQVKSFGLPTAPVLAFWLGLSAEAGPLGFVDHVFDLSASADIDFLQAVRAAGALVVVLAAPDGRTSEWNVGIHSEVLESHLGSCARYLSALERVDGPRAVSDFMAVYAPAMRERNDVAAAWAAVEQSLAAEPPFVSCFGVFPMPTGAVAVCWLETKLAGGETVFAQRMFDLSLTTDRDYLQRAAKDGVIEVSFTHPSSGAIERRVPRFDPTQFEAFLRSGKEYLADATRADGPRAMTDFAELVARVRREHDDFDRSWSALGAGAVALTNAARAAARDEAVQRGISRQRRFYWFGRTIQIVASIPVAGPWAVALAGPALVLLPALGVFQWLGLIDDRRPSWFDVVFFVTLTAWTGYLHGAGILRLDAVPLIPSPIWIVGAVLALMAIVGLF